MEAVKPFQFGYNKDINKSVYVWDYINDYDEFITTNAITDFNDLCIVNLNYFRRTIVIVNLKK